MKTSIVTNGPTTGLWLTNNTMLCIYVNEQFGQVIGTYENANHPAKAHNKAVAIKKDGSATLQVVSDKNVIRIIDIPADKVKSAIENMLNSLVGDHYDELQDKRPTQL